MERGRSALQHLKLRQPFPLDHANINFLPLEESCGHFRMTGNSAACGPFPIMVNRPHDIILITEESTCCSLPSRKRPPSLTSLPAPPSRFSSRPIRVNVHFVYSSEPSHISRLRSRRHHHRLSLLVGRMVGLAGPAPTPLHTTASKVSLVCNLPSRRRREEAARE